MFTDVAVEADGTVLAARDQGAASSQGAVPLVLVHGLSSNLAIWDLVAPALAKRHRVIAYDQRSHGHSSDGDGDFSFDALVGDLEAVIAHFALADPVIVGHSWGASVALEYAARVPACPRVVCVDGGVIDMQALGTDWPTAEQLLRPPRLIGTADEIEALVRREQNVIGWDRLGPVFRRGRVDTGDGLTRPRLRFDDHMTIAHELWAQRTWDLYERVAPPVMLVLAEGVERGPRDQGFVAIKKLSAERVVERKNDVRLEWLRSVHDIPLYAPDELVTLIDGFVSDSS